MAKGLMANHFLSSNTSDATVNRMFLRGQLHISRRYGMNRTNGLVVSLNGSALDEAKCKRRRGASIALVTRTRNQAYGLNDFLAHHVQLGVSHVFLLVDRLSTDNTASVARPWAALGLVTVVRPDSRSLDKPANEWFQHAARQFDWVGYIDMDEFLMPFRDRCLTDLVLRYRTYGGIKLKWSQYEGWQGTPSYLHERRFPQRLVLEALGFQLGEDSLMTKELGQSRHVRQIASRGRMPHCNDYWRGPWLGPWRGPWLGYFPNFTAVDEWFIPRNYSRVCWHEGGIYPDKERLVALLHVHPVSLEAWLDRELRNLDAADHVDSGDATSNFDLSRSTHKFFDERARKAHRPMPASMEDIARELTASVRRLCTVADSPRAEGGPHGQPRESDASDRVGDGQVIPSRLPASAVVS